MSNQKEQRSEQDHHKMMGEALHRLVKNSDFKLIITNGYFVEKALASVSMLGVPQVKEKGERPNLMEDLVAISNLQYYFQMIESFYQGAVDPILSDEEQATFDAMQLETQQGAAN